MDENKILIRWSHLGDGLILYNGLHVVFILLLCLRAEGWMVALAVRFNRLGRVEGHASCHNISSKSK